MLGGIWYDFWNPSDWVPPTPPVSDVATIQWWVLKHHAHVPYGHFLSMAWTFIWS